MVVDMIKSLVKLTNILLTLLTNMTNMFAKFIKCDPSYFKHVYVIHSMHSSSYT